MKYTNPILNMDFSDPDAIRVGNDFFMIASSFNHTPGVPILHSKNLVEWNIINYVYDNIPFSRFNDAIHGAGCWAPSLRLHDGIFYAIIPFIDEGIYVSSTTDPFGSWSEPWCLIEGSGIEDPCPIWLDDKCYLAVGFAKSRMGFNSVIGIYEVSSDLKTKIADYKIVYDGHNDNPTIEGPKFNERNGYIYIMAPAGSVKTGWQTCLRSKNIYGPYETKIVLTQGDSDINGPHQGALIDIDDSDNWAFIHFQDKGCYGRITHLEPVKWINDWPICGLVRDELLAGTPVSESDYPLLVKTDYNIDTNDYFDKKNLSLIWQFPANHKKTWYDLSDKLKLNCLYHNEKADNSLSDFPNILLSKISYLNFDIETEINIDFKEINDEAGLCLYGAIYSYLEIIRCDDGNHIRILKGSFEKKEDEILYDKKYDKDNVKFGLKYFYPNSYFFLINGQKTNINLNAAPGRWIGTKIGIFARGRKNSKGFAKFNYFKNERSE